MSLLNPSIVSITLDDIPLFEQELLIKDLRYTLTESWKEEQGDHVSDIDLQLDVHWMGISSLQRRAHLL